MTRLTQALLLLPAAALALSASALAQDDPRPRGGPSHAAVKAAAEKRKEMLDKAADKRAAAADKREAAAEARAAAADKREAAADKRAARREERAEIREAWAKLKETRKERRRERREEVKRLWGELHKQPAARNELRVHAWRMARLNRMRTIAKADGKDKLVARIDTLMEKERTRHKRKMEQLKEKGGAQ